MPSLRSLIPPLAAAQRSQEWHRSVSWKESLKTTVTLSPSACRSFLSSSLPITTSILPDSTILPLGDEVLDIGEGQLLVRIHAPTDDADEVRHQY